MRRLILVGFALLLAISLMAQPAAPKNAPAVVQEFYNWYLGELSQSREPLTRKPAELKKYVTAAMLADIQRRMKSPDGLDADPFLLAQDFPEDWKDNVSVTTKSATAVLVTLGKKEESRNQLLIEVRTERGLSKIAKVDRLHP